MDDINKLISLLEELPISEAEMSNDGLINITKKLQLTLNLAPCEFKNLETLKSIEFFYKTKPVLAFTYVGYLCHILLKLKENIDKENIIASRMDLIFKGMNLIIKFGILPSVNFRFKSRDTRNIIRNFDDEYAILYNSVKFFLAYMDYDYILGYSNGKDILLHIFYGVTTLVYITTYKHFECDVLNEEKFSKEVSIFALQQLPAIKNEFSDAINSIPTKDCFKLFMVLNTSPNITKELHTIVTNNLNELLMKPNGLDDFVVLMVESEPKKDYPSWKKGEIISKIVSVKGYPFEFYEYMVDRVCNFLETNINSSNQFTNDLLPIYTLTLNRLYYIPIPANDKLKKDIKKFLFGSFDVLTEPPDVLAGLILMDDTLFIKSISILYNVFYGTSTCTMRSVLLVPYIHILYEIYSELPANSKEKEQINILIVQCLSNRDPSSLKLIIESILFDEPLKEMKKIHPRVSITYNEKLNKQYEIKVIPAENLKSKQFYYTNFIDLLKSSNHNIFIYNTFLCVLKLLEQILDETNQNSTDGDNALGNYDDMENLLYKKFYKKITIVNTLNEIILIKSFHSQFYENPQEILEFIKIFLEKQIENINVINDELIIVILSVFNVFANKILHKSLVNEITLLLKKFKGLKISDTLKKQIDLTLSEIDSNSSFNCSDISPYKFAMSLCNEKEPFLIAHGFANLLKLVRRRDENALSKRYEILLMCIRNLRTDQESFSYLNCIKLLTDLSTIFDTEVFESLFVEFENDKNELDFRLKIGEVIVKVTESLKELAYKHKDILINCFMRESRSTINELRTSSLSNLGTVCRLLSYQVHGFFQELINLIQNIIETDTYVPARRGAVLVLSHLLFGIDNLLEFQDYLLPIYRTLKYVVKNETDESTLLHAEIGLETLKTKTKEFLLPEPEMKKEIKILGINEDKNEIKLPKGSNPKIVELD